MKKLLIAIALAFCMLVHRPALAQVQPVSATLTAASTGVCLPTNCLAYSVPSGVGSATFQIGGNTTFSGTVQFEEVLFDGSYYPLNGTPSNSATQATSATGPGSWQVSLAGRSTVRMRVTVLGSGSVAAAINPSTASAKAAGGSSGSSTIAIPATVSGATSGGFPCFDSTIDMNSTAAIGAGVLLKGGGAGACGAASLATDNGTSLVYTGANGITGPNGTTTNPTFNFASSIGMGFYRRAADVIGVSDSGEIAEFFGASPVGLAIGSSSSFQFTNGGPSATRDTSISRVGPDIIGIGNGNGTNSSGFSKSAMTVFTAADVTCGTTGTIADCTTAQTVTGLSITLPLSAQSWTFDCNGVVDQATGTAANQWLIQTATNGATSTTAYYMMATAAGVSLVGAVTDQASTTTAFQITPSWTLGATGTKMPFHIWGTISGASASGTVFNLQVINPTNADLLTIYRGASCSLAP